jgi:hypothetical protein
MRLLKKITFLRGLEFAVSTVKLDPRLREDDGVVVVKTEWAASRY